MGFRRLEVEQEGERAQMHGGAGEDPWRGGGGLAGAGRLGLHVSQPSSTHHLVVVSCEYSSDGIVGGEEKRLSFLLAFINSFPPPSNRLLFDTPHL
jgi:hypothetical protein